MTPEAQNNAIAAACGFTSIRMVMCDAMGLLNGKLSFLPDYLNDLNAMVEAEKMIKAKGLFPSYLSALALVCGFKPQGDEAWYKLHAGCEAVTSATAAQRAAAFLRTLNLWKDES
jgi:hypothetical protein